MNRHLIQTMRAMGAIMGLVALGEGSIMLLDSLVQLSTRRLAATKPGRAV
jgi:hypothetical protein